MAVSDGQSLLPRGDIVPSANVIKLIGEIDQFNGRWLATQSLAPQLLRALEHAALVSSTGSSTRIEGTQLDNSAVEKVLIAKDIDVLASQDEQDVAGYAAALREVISSYPSIEVSEAGIRQLHNTMLQYGSKDNEHRGRYKIMPNMVTAFDQLSKRQVVWLRAVPPEDTPRMMQELIAWFNAENNSGQQHALLLIASFIVVLLAIHPFQDGNGRLARLLTTLLMLKAGYTYVPYSAMESIVEDNKQDYYQALHFTQQTLPTTQQNWQPWLNFFITTAHQQKNLLAAKLTAEQSLLGALLPVARQILEFVNNQGDASVSEITTGLSISRNVARTQLRNLVTHQHVEMTGKGRAVRYRKKHVATK